MCPGGFIVPSATAPGEIVVNGMSPSRRDSKYSNSGMVVSIDESDWKEYYGSNKELQADVDKFGKDSFKREILKLCKTKGEFGYYEAKYQFDNNVLESNDYYNSWIMVRVHKKHLTLNRG